MCASRRSSAVVLAGFSVLLAAWSGGACAEAGAGPEIRHFYGYAYDLDSGQYLYTEVYRQEIEHGRWLRGGTRYFWPDGKQLGERRLDFSADPYVPVCSLELPYAGYTDGITKVTSTTIEMYKQSREKGRQDATIPKTAPMTADAGFDGYLREHMDELVAGKTVAFRLGVPGQLDAYDFRARKLGDTTFEGKPAVELRIEPDSLLRFLVKPLLLIYDPMARRMLEYRGVSNILNPATGKVYNVRVTFYSRPPDDAPKNLPPLD